MKGLRIIPIFLFLIICTYAGTLFVKANGDEVIITLGNYESPPTAIGFVVLTSVLAGMIFCGFFCSIEMLALYLHNRKLKRRLEILAKKSLKETGDKPGTVETMDARVSNRFT